MNDNPRANGSRGHDPYAALRLVALIAAIAGVLVLAAAAFVLSYGGIHKIALSAGVSASMARIFPVIFDAMLVVSCAAVLSLRAAGWWQRAYSWLTTLVLLAVVAAADAVHATGTHIPRKPAAATIAVLPWLLLLLAFSLLLSMMRQFRHTRAAVAGQTASSGPATAGNEAAGPEVPEPGAAEPATAVPAAIAPGTTPPGAAGRPGLEVLERRGPGVQPSPPRTATQPSAADPARTVVDTIPVRESAPPLTLPAGSLPAGTLPPDTVPPDTVPTARTPAPPAPAPPAPTPADVANPGPPVSPDTPTDSPSPQYGPAAGPGAAAHANGTRPADSEEPPQRTPLSPTQTPRGPEETVPDPESPGATASPRGPGETAVTPDPPAGPVPGASADPASEATAPVPDVAGAARLADHEAAASQSADHEPASHEPADHAPADREPAGQQAPDQPAGAREADDQEAGNSAPADQGSADQEPAGEEQAVREQAALEEADEQDATSAQAGGDQPGRDVQPGGDQPGGDQAEPATDQSSGSGTIHVPHQAMPAPVPAPSPHFDRLRSTPTPPEDEPDSDG